jgi:hypothetical protein
LLQSVNLDDQTYESIIEYIMSELPRLCPPWTDYNGHDPGITILELIAWYKEMQQYHMNMVTEAMLRRLFALAGIESLPAQASTALVTLPPGCRALPEFTRLVTSDGLVFETTEPYRPAAELTGVYALDGGGGETYLGDFLAQPNISAAPFQYGGTDTRLLLTLEKLTGESVRLYFDVADEYEVARNPFRDDRQTPRVIKWEFDGFGEFTPGRDETHALSISGFVAFEPPPGAEKLRVVLTLTDRGCEEDVRLRNVSSGVVRVEQRETLSRCEFVGGDEAAEYLSEPPGPGAERLMFARRSEGWEQLEPDPSGCGGRRGASGYNGEELLVVTVDSGRIDQMVFDSTGLPDMTLPLPILHMRPMTDGMLLICDTRCSDGAVRPDIWTYTDDLRAARPGARVFTLDADGQNMMFGDGEYGAVVPGGRNAVIMASYAVSFLSGSNTSESVMTVVGGGETARGSAARQGRAAESIDEMARRLAHRLRSANKCMSARDYERAAMGTPGLRVDSAKALAGCDPDEPTGRSGTPVVSVVVTPWSARPGARADGRFLSEVRAHLNRMRPIGVRIKVLPETPPGYADGGDFQ